MNIKRIIDVAKGESEADLLLCNAKVFNVFTKEIIHADVAIVDGIIAGVGQYIDKCAKEIIDLEGAFLVPGFINAHCHVESSMVVPERYCQEELRHGVTTLVTDPHEIANVLGLDGILYMLGASENAPVNYFVQLPSCVPATCFEHAGATLRAEDLLTLKNHPRVLGLGEMMDYPGVLSADTFIMKKLEAFQDMIIDGHAPGLTGCRLQAYTACGIRTDHESSTASEALEKLRAGMAVLVRQGSASRNLKEIISGVLKAQVDTRNLAFCTDDKHLSDIRREGTIRQNLKMAVALGLDSLTALQIATWNAAQIYKLKNIGAIAPGYQADLVILKDLSEFHISAVYKDGCLMVKEGKLLQQKPDSFATGAICDTVNLPPVEEKDLILPDWDRLPVIRIHSGEIITSKEWVKKAEVPDRIADGSLRKVVVIERHHATGNIGVGLIAGYGLHHGAVATTVAHDSHNLIVVGDNNDDILFAIQVIKEMKGGYCLVKDGKDVGSLPLRVGGLMSDVPVEEFLTALDDMLKKAADLGVSPGIDPFITLSFIALPVIPSIRLTDCGMFDVDRFSMFDHCSEKEQ